METPEQVEKAQARIAHIDELKKCPAWAAYYLPRLREKQAAIGQKVLSDEKLSPEERERLRRVWTEYEHELRKFVDSDEQVAKNVLLRANLVKS